MHISSSPYARSAISNGKRSHRTRAQGGIDGRSRAARRWRDAYGDFVCQLGHDPNPVEQTLLRSACDLVIANERLSEAVADGRATSPEELDRLQRLNGALRRTLVALGLGSAGAEPEADRERRALEDQEAGLA
jgi:hypothetical protein